MPPRGDLSARQLHFVCGKGGTGKSVVACALARELVQRGGTVLLVQVNAKDSHARMLGIPAVGDDVHEALPGFFVVNTTPAASLKEYALMTLRFETVYRAVFENRVTRAFLRFMPALSELTMLGKITYHAGELRPGFDARSSSPAARRFTHIVVDCPATGHGLKFLDTARVIARALKRGPLADKTREMAALLADPQRSALHTVTLPDELPVNETMELVARARATGVVPLGAVVLNQLSPCLLTPALRESLQRVLASPATPAADSPAGRALAVGAFRARRETTEAHEQQRVRGLGLPVVELPRLPASDLGRPELERLARRFSVVLGRSSA